MTFPPAACAAPAAQNQREYLVYFLDEPQGKVLLSIAPADHEDAELWLPIAPGLRHVTDGAPDCDDSYEVSYHSPKLFLSSFAMVEMQNDF